MPEFIPGLALAESFYTEAVRTILMADFPALVYSAGLIGSGSEVLGFDTEMSADHHWGPRLMMFLHEEDLARLGAEISKALSLKLPRRFNGYPTSYSSPDLHDKGVQQLDYDNEGPIKHRVELLTIAGYWSFYLGFDISKEISAADWLTFPEQKLRTLTGGRIFHDQVGLQDMQARFHYYPHEVWLYLLASCWSRIEQDEHLMGRAGSVGDEIGSAIIAGRLVRDLMRLCFLMEKQHAPYGKWFGTAFRKLACADVLADDLEFILHGKSWQEREKHLVVAYRKVATMHNQLKITKPMPIDASDFFGRPFQVISKGNFSSEIKSAITDPVVKEIASRRLIGNIDLVSDNTDLLEDRRWRKRVKSLYQSGGVEPNLQEKSR
jgi:hypothetical protein